MQETALTADEVWQTQMHTRVDFIDLSAGKRAELVRRINALDRGVDPVSVTCCRIGFKSQIVPGEATSVSVAFESGYRMEARTRSSASGVPCNNTHLRREQ